MLQGAFTALITPFRKDAQLDTEALSGIIEHQIIHGINGLVCVGTTGESPTVNHEENLRVVEWAIRIANGRVPIIAGTGSNATSEALSMTQQAKELGADFTLQVVPYYNKPSQEGLYRHFSTIADKGGLPVIVYNIPGRTGQNLEIETLLRLARHTNIAAVKDATGSLPALHQLIMQLPSHISILSGNDDIALINALLGGHGVISVASNIVPDKVSLMIQSALNGKLEESRTLHFQLQDLFIALFVETNPMPVKYAMHLLGFCEEVYRLPLCAVQQSTKDLIRQVLQQLSLKIRQ